MKRCITAIVVVSVVAGILLTQVTRARYLGNPSFLGVWESIDPEDGSGQTMLISGGENGLFGLHVRDTYWTVCVGRRGILTGLGGHALDDKEILIFDGVISCFDPDEDVSELTLTFELAGKNILLRGVENPPFFRISNRGRH